MSRSYYKNSFSSMVCHSRRAMKAWRSQENRRLRHSAKQLINSCEDYDNLIIPVLNDFDTMWGSPIDGRKFYVKKPLLNQCEADRHKLKHGWSSRWFGKKEKDFDGQHYKKCTCYSNKRGAWYWKTRRK